MGARFFPSASHAWCREYRSFDQSKSVNPVRSHKDDIDAWTIASTVAVAMVVAWLVGRRIGQRLRLRSEGKAAVSKFLDASLAVLGLLLAFTFSTALVKHDQRRLMVVAINDVGVT